MLVTVSMNYQSGKKGEVNMLLFRVKSKPKDISLKVFLDEYQKLTLTFLKEIKKLQKEVKENGLTIVPTKLYFNTSKLKVEVCLARGKKLYDKRQDLKEKDSKRDIERALKNAY